MQAYSLQQRTKLKRVVRSFRCSEHANIESPMYLKSIKADTRGQPIDSNTQNISKRKILIFVFTINNDQTNDVVVASIVRVDSLRVSDKYGNNVSKGSEIPNIS